MMDQLRLADGTVIATSDGKRTVSTEINAVFDEQEQGAISTPVELLMGKRRYLDDLPMPFLQSRAVAIIASYTMFGLTAGDIGRILNVATADVLRIRASADYTSFMEGVLQNVREHDTNAVRRRLNKAAKGAAKKIVELSSSSSEKIALAASQDILNRTGHKPSDTVEHKHSMEGGITIRHIRNTETPPTIDVEALDG